MAKEYTMKQWALAYANKGIAVFPLMPRDKKPLTQNGCKDASIDPGQINAWWDKHPNANIGIATGFISAGLFVIDLDIDKNKGINGYETLRNWENTHKKLPDTWQSITGRGGNHLFYWSLELINNRVNILEGIDIRGEGGYVVAPPSTHPNGNKYEWEQSPEEFDILEADDTVLEFLRQGKEEHQSFVSPIVIIDGERNNTLFKLSSSLQARGLSDSAIMKAVKEENEVKCNPPLSDREVETIVKSALKYDKGDYTQKHIATNENGVIKPFPKLDLICLNTVEIEDIQWLWYPYIARGKVTIIQGEPGSSKTTMGLKIASCVSTGEPFPGELKNPFANLREPANVIYQTAEDGLSDTIMNRLKHMNPDFNRIFVIDESKEPITMMDNRIRQALDITKAELIILDPLTAYLGSKVNMNMANEVRPVMNRAVQFAKEFNTAVVIIAHMSKMTSAQAKNRLIGSIDFVGAARSVLTIGFNPNNSAQRALAQTKNNLAPFGKTLLYHLDYSNGGVVFDDFSNLTDDEIISPADKKNTKASIALEEAKEFLKEAMKESYIKADEVLQMASDEGITSATLHLAKKALGIQSKRYGYGKNSTNWWRYPNYEIPKEVVENIIGLNT